jgi:hypothetical protein
LHRGGGAHINRAIYTSRQLLVLFFVAGVSVAAVLVVLLAHIGPWLLRGH